jgi:hypothetical protein
MTVSNLFASAAVAALCAGSIFLASQEFGVAFKAQAARSLQRAAAPNPQLLQEDIKRFVEAPSVLIDGCSPAALDAAIEIETMHADLYTPYTDRDLWVAALQRLEGDARKALNCQPTNGLLWARLAFASWFLGRSATDQAAYLNYSQLYAPAELPAIRARFTQWARVSPVVMEQARQPFQRDLQTLLLWVPAPLAASLLKALPAIYQPAIDEIASYMPEERFQALKKHGVTLRAGS